MRWYSFASFFFLAVSASSAHIHTQKPVRLILHELENEDKKDINIVVSIKVQVDRCNRYEIAGRFIASRRQTNLYVGHIIIKDTKKSCPSEVKYWVNLTKHFSFPSSKVSLLLNEEFKIRRSREPLLIEEK